MTTTTGQIEQDSSAEQRRLKTQALIRVEAAGGTLFGGGGGHVNDNDDGRVTLAPFTQDA